MLVTKIPGDTPTPFKVMKVSPCLKRLGKVGEKTTAGCSSVSKGQDATEQAGGEV